MRLVVGLGNPGPKYERNRHNVGFMAVDEIVRRHSFSAWRSRFQGLASEGELAGEKLLILKPATFMNESGRSVGEAMRFFKLAPSDVTVLYDELDLAPARIKVKQGGGNGGHNGLKSIDAHVGKDYWRVRIGIGHPGDKARVVGHVLSDFGKTEWPGFERLIEGISDRFDLLAQGKASDFMSKLAMDLSPPKDPAPKKKPSESAAPARPAGAAGESGTEESGPGTSGPGTKGTGGGERDAGLAAQLKRWMSGGSDQ